MSPSRFFVTVLELIRRLKAWRAAKREDRAAIARARQQEMRVGDEQPSSIAETVDDVAGQYPPPT